MIDKISSNNTYMQPDIGRSNKKDKNNNKNFSLDSGVRYSRHFDLEKAESDFLNEKTDLQEYTADSAVKVPDYISDGEINPDKNFLNRIKNVIKEFSGKFLELCDRIWNGKTDLKSKDAEETDEIKNIDDSVDIKDMNMREVSEYLSEGGKRKLAKNSDLLTRYDHLGRIVSVDPSEENKIFHGNKIWKEL